MIAKTILAVILLTSASTFAALPPLAESAREIQAILSAQEGYDLLGGADPIEQIIRTPSGYLIITSRKEMKVDVNYAQSGKIGPAEFTLKFHPPVNIDRTARS
jgi:hypothetical protein